MIWTHTAYGHVCPSCGDRIGRASATEEARPDACRQCGYPDIDAVADYHGPDDDDADGSSFDEFDDCGLMPDGQCLKAGTEECDWECGRLG